MTKLKYQQPHSIKLEQKYYFNSVLAEHLIEKEHHRQKYLALRNYKDDLKKGVEYAIY